MCSTDRIPGVRVLTAGLFCLLLVSCGQSNQAVLRIGVDNAPPFHIVKPDGSVEGMAVDVFNEAAKRRHIRIVWVPYMNSTIQKAFESGLIDAWPAVSRTPERDRLYHFSEPWIGSDYYLVTRRESSIRHQNSAGIRLAFADFGRLKIVVNRFFSKPVNVLTKSHTEALVSFCAGQADAALVDARALDGILLTRPPGCGSVALRLELVPEASNPVSIASTPAMGALADSLQKGIMELAGDGSLWAPIDKWSGFTAGQTRSFFALREVESRRDLYMWLFSMVTLCVVGLGWMISRLSAAQRKAREAQLAASDSEARFQAFMDNSPLIGFIKDEGCKMIYLNRRFVDVFGLAPEECLGKDDFELWPPDTATEMRRNDLQILRSGKSVEFIETTPMQGSEDITWLSMKFRFRQGLRTYLGGMAVDITERERAKEALRISEERFRSLFAHATVGIAIADQHGVLTRVNGAFCRILRLSEGECLDSSVQGLLEVGAEPAPELLRRRVATGSTFESNHQRNGATLWTENCLFAVRDSAGNILNMVVIVEDITQRKIAEAQLDFQARHDLLTGLTNRRVHETYLEERIEDAARHRRKISLLYVDLDDFKLVNDTLGHDAGDLVLQEAAVRLSSLAGDTHSLSRIGGDEFVLVQTVENRQDALALASRLRLAMEQPFQVNGKCVELRASAGFSIYPDDGLDARTLRKKADDAMYAAKRMEKSRRYSRSEKPAESLSVLSALQ